MQGKVCDRQAPARTTGKLEVSQMTCNVWWCWRYDYAILCMLDMNKNPALSMILNAIDAKAMESGIEALNDEIDFVHVVSHGKYYS